MVMLLKVPVSENTIKRGTDNTSDDKQAIFCRYEHMCALYCVFWDTLHKKHKNKQFNTNIKLHDMSVHVASASLS